MTFNFNEYSTPLLLGFVQGWIYAGLFWWRGLRQGRLSDWLFGCLLVAMAFNIWEYMLGFAGIEILWRELSFFPRNFTLLLSPLAYFYLKSQFNAGFRLRWGDLKHALPFLLHTVYHLGVFAQGPDFVQYWEANVHVPFGFEYLEMLLEIVVQVLYIYWAYQLYREYRRWAPTQFSDTETVSFRWFRNFLLAFLAGNFISWGMTLLDFWLKLDFWHDWWDELFNAALIYYLAIEGYAQKQPRTLRFSAPESSPPEVSDENNPMPKTEKIAEAELPLWKERLETAMSGEKPWLDPELTLPALAQRLDTNPSILSAAINGAFGKNFNDFVNAYRVEAVKRMLKDPANSHYSLLGIGLECGFNSKSTFNRVFKKMTGVAPGGFWGE